MNEESNRLEDNIGLVHLLSSKIYKRVAAMNIGMTYEDLFQELSVVYLQALKSFDLSKGYKFSTYFTTSAFHFADRMIDREARYEIKIKGQSMTVESEEGLCQLDFANSDSDCAKIIEAEESLLSIYKGLSPLSKKAVDMALSPSVELVREVEMRNAKNDVAIERGTAVRRFKASTLDVSIVLVARLCNVSAYRLNKMREEVRPLIEVIA